MMGKERKKEEERSYLLIESYVSNVKEYIDSILISKKKRILNKGGNDYLLTIQLITGFHRLNYILSFERDQLILIENEEKSHTKSLCEFVKL